MELLGQVVKPDPTLSVLDAFKLLHYLLLRVPSLLDGEPELLELFLRDGTIVVHINLVEELFRGDFSECALPVVHSLVLVDCVTAVDVENVEHFIHLLHTLRRQLASLNK